MKRFLPLLLSLLLLGCASAPAAAHAETPFLSPAPTPQGPFAAYRFYEQDDCQDLTGAVMFEVDLDQDGRAEPVSFALQPHDEWATAISWGDSTVVLDSDEFVEAVALDLDPESPFYNLLVTVDYGSDSYNTIELHPENGRLVMGRTVSGSWEWADGSLWFFEHTDFLGTASGKRVYRGDDLSPESEWLTMCYIPTGEELAEERAELVEYGTLLHTVLPVPCTVDGAPRLIPANSYLYRLRFRCGDDLTEVCLPDGTRAQIACTVGEHGWPYLIDGRDMTEYFDNLFFAD